MPAFPDSPLAHRLLDGLEGLEIGGASHNPFNLTGALNVDYSDNMHTAFKEEERKTAGWALPVDLVAWGDNLPVPDESLDYVISSHVLEHFYDPIRAIEEWLRVVRFGGYLFMVVPHKERTVDAPRPRTTLAELLDRHASEAPEIPEQHLLAHQSVWVTEDLVELCRYLQLEVVEVLDVDDKVGNGFTVVARKPGRLPAKNAPVPVRSIGPLDLGCGTQKRARFLGLDLLPLRGVDIVADLTQPLPFADATVTAVSSTWTLQLLAEPARLLRELVRACKNGAEIELWTPHARSDYAAFRRNLTPFTDLTWVDLMQSGACDTPHGHLVWEQALYLCRQQTLDALAARKIDLDFAVSHLSNVILEIGVRLRVRKGPREPGRALVPEGRVIWTNRDY